MRDLALFPVAAENIDEYYDGVAAGMDKVLEKGGDLGWTVYSVYHELKLDAAELWIAFDGEEYVGFFVLTKGQEAVSSATFMYVWIAYSKIGNGVSLFLPILEQVALEQGHSKLKFGTTRKGWSRVAEKIGFTVEEVRYTKNI